MTGDALALLGCGWITRRHAVAARRVGIPVVFGSHDEARARAYAREFGGIAAYGSYPAALADPRTFGAVVCTPHDRHVADGLVVLGAGRALLLEKPIARTLGEADTIIAAAEASGLTLMVGENFHFMPAYRHVRALLDEGALGDLRELSLVARGYRARTGWRAGLASSGGGALIDGGIHYVHNLRWWGGEPRRIFALRPPPTIPGFEGEDAIAVLATLERGVLGFVANSLAAPGMARLQWSTLIGTRASVFVDNRGRFVLLRGGGRPRFRFFRRDVRGHEAMLREFRAAATAGRRAECDGRSGRRDLELVLAAYRSLRDGQPVDLAC